MEESLVPFGFRFRPSDEEIVGSFLYPFLVESKPFMSLYNNFLHACNLFGNNTEPSEIWKKYGGPQLVDTDLYFISKLKKLTPKRMDRRIGNGGTWSETESSKLVHEKVSGNPNPNPIGRKRKFRYENKGSEDHTGWLLDEYSLFDGPKNDYNQRSYDFDFVICRMRKNDRVGIKATNLKRGSQDKEEKKMTTNKKMKTDDQMGSTESSSQQGCSSSPIGGDLVGFDPIDLTIFEEKTMADMEQLLGEAWSPSNFEDAVSYDVDPIGETQINFENEENTMADMEQLLGEAWSPSNFEDAVSYDVDPIGETQINFESEENTRADMEQLLGEAWSPSNFENVVSHDVDPIGETQSSQLSNWSQAILNQLLVGV
ncbi:hypothetical protein L3X38_001919 [Prunus dulcis]|uniref:NAC domain-containing protein n=1 Tax=Prunus dulcis TaxID=3755 RepID=A0AAD4WUZ5_PRUDU|nr:hypothetical protein L3X38_001919 [Prunus dulcis]